MADVHHSAQRIIVSALQRIGTGDTEIVDLGKYRIVKSGAFAVPLTNVCDQFVGDAGSAARRHNQRRCFAQLKCLGRNFRPWKWVDIPLRGLKYMLLFFFLQAVLGMSSAALQEFIQSPYNRVADVKMGLFFVRLGPVGAGVMLTLVVLSILVHGAWCRYLCPYGALLGLISRFSPMRVERRADACVDCGLCDKVCMARLPVSRLDKVSSVECTGCLDCVATCPVVDALEVKATRRWKMSVPAFALAVVLLFLGGYAGARMAGYWHSDLSDAEYSHRIRNLDRPEYGHPGS